MNISPAALVNASAPAQPSQVAQASQVLVLKKAMDVEAQGAVTLIQSLPLASSGNLGTKLNTLA